MCKISKIALPLSDHQQKIAPTYTTRTSTKLISAIKWNDNMKIIYWVNTYDFCAAWYQSVTTLPHNRFLFSMYLAGLALKQRLCNYGPPSATLTRHCVNPGWTTISYTRPNCRPWNWAGRGALLFSLTKFSMIKHRTTWKIWSIAIEI